MDEKVVESHIKQIPSVIIDALSPLSDKNSWGVYIALLQKDEGMRFNEIKEHFGASPAEISRILKKLANGGLVAKKVRNIDDFKKSEAWYYAPTPLGINLIKGLYHGLLPRKISCPIRLSGNANLFNETISLTFVDKKCLKNVDSIGQINGSAWPISSSAQQRDSRSQQINASEIASSEPKMEVC